MMKISKITLHTLLVLSVPGVMTQDITAAAQTPSLRTTNVPSDRKLQAIGSYDSSIDHLEVHFDMLWDIDDCHCIGAMRMIFDYYDIDATVVTGTHSPQKSQGFAPYGNELEAMDIAFGTQCTPGNCAGLSEKKGWVNADSDWDDNGSAPLVEELGQVWLDTLIAGGSVWIAEGGMGDFTLDVAQWIGSQNVAGVNMKNINSVQHSPWNINNSGPGVYDALEDLITVTVIGNGNGFLNSGKDTTAPEFASRRKFANDAASGIYADLWNQIWKGDGGWRSKVDFSDTSELLHILDKVDELKDFDTTKAPWENFMDIYNVVDSGNPTTSNPVNPTKSPINPTASPVMASPVVASPVMASPVAQQCVASSFKGECKTTGKCKNMYEGSDDCLNAIGGVCMCNNMACGCVLPSPITPPATTAPITTSPPIAAPTTPPTANDGNTACRRTDFLGECKTTVQCKQMYPGGAEVKATDCKNYLGGVCYCGSAGVCGCQ